MVALKIILAIIFAAFIIFLLVVFILFTYKDRQALFAKPQTLEHQGQIRTYRLVSAKENQNKPQLVVVLDGLGGSGRRAAYYTAFHNTVGEDTVVVYPDPVEPTQPKIKPGWNASFCCGSGWKSGADDAGFIVAIVKKLVQENNVDPTRVFVTGFSNGAIFTHKLLADYPEVFAGFAAYSGSIGANGQVTEPTKPVAGILLHGQLDKVLPYNGGVGSTDKDFNWKSFKDTAETWARVNRCSNPLLERLDNKNQVSYGQCAKPLKLITYTKDKHIWHDWRLTRFWRQDVAGSQDIMKFFNSL